MESENLCIPVALLARVREAVAAEEISMQELVRDALERRLNQQEWRRTLEFGETHARERGLKPEDVNSAIASVRERGR